MTSSDAELFGPLPLYSGQWYGPIDLSRTYVYETEDFHAGRGVFVWLPDLGRLALMSSSHVETGHSQRDVTPPQGHSTETFLGLQVGGDLYLIDLGSARHLGLPAFTSLKAELPGGAGPE